MLPFTKCSDIFETGSRKLSAESAWACSKTTDFSANQRFFRRAVHIVIYVGRELSKRVLLQTFQEDSSSLNRLREKQWSVIQRTSKYVTVTLDRYEKLINPPTGSFNRYIIFKDRFKGPKLKSRSQVKDSPEFIGAFYEGEYVSYNQNPISFKA